MRLLSTVVLLTFSFSSFAQQLVKGTVSKRVEMEESPSFFFKVKADGSLISYTVPPQGRNASGPGQNKIINIRTGVITNIPGPHDPVFVGNLDLVIIPNISHTQYEIYRTSELLKSITNPLSLVTSLKGYYQSAGVLKTTSTTSTIRVIAEQSAGAHSLIDFKYTTAEKLILDDSQTNILCPNSNMKLPMLSKDGRYVGGIDIDTNTSGIWKIHSNLNCEKVADLGIKTGKLNFNYDNSKLTYHIYKKIEDADSDASDNYVPLPENTYISNIYVFDMKTSTHSQVTKSRSSNSMYPDFTKDGRLVFVNHPHTKKKVSFVFVKL